MVTFIGGSVYLLDEELEQIWTRSLTSTIACKFPRNFLFLLKIFLAISVDGSVVYVTTLTPSIYGLDLATGETLWVVILTDNVLDFAPTVPVGDGSVLVLGDSTMLRFVACSSNGICSNNTCKCDVNYYTDDCSVYCNQAQCVTESHNNGGCSAEGVCGCYDNYFPVRNCSVFCNNTECKTDLNNHGRCSDEGECACDKDWYEDDCTFFCQNGVYDNDTCHCYENYHGDACDVGIEQ